MDCSQVMTKQIIQFVYEGECEITRSNLFEFLEIADRYNMISLIRYCEDKLWNWLNRENCREYYLKAICYCLQSKNAIHNYVLNSEKVNGKKLT